jgi:hypothetical protein
MNKDNVKCEQKKNPAGWVQSVAFSRLMQWLDDKKQLATFIDLSFGTLTPLRLVGAMPVWQHLLEILRATPDATRASVNHVSIESWPSILETLTKNPISLSNYLFSGTTKARKERELFLQTLPPNPLSRRGMTEYSLFACLWTSHSSKPAAFRTLQRHATLAHLPIIQAHYSVDDWLSGKPLKRAVSSRFYLAGLHIRYFSQPCGKLESMLRDDALGRMPLNCSLQDFPDEVSKIAVEIAKIELLNNKDLAAEYSEAARRRNRRRKKRRDSDIPEPINIQKVSQSLRWIAAFLRWSLQPNVLPTHECNGGGGNPYGGGSPVSGWNEDTSVSVEVENESDDDLDKAPDNFDRDKLAFGDGNDPDDSQIEVRVQVRSSLTDEELSSRISAGDHPSDTGTERTLYYADDEEGVRLIFGSAPEMALQSLSYSFDDLSPFELSPALNSLRDGANSGVADLIEIYALCSTCVWPGSKLQSAINLLLFENDIPDSVHNLSCCLGPGWAFWRKPSLEVDLSIDVPEHVARRIEKHFDLPDLVGGSNPVRMYLNYLRTVIGLPAAQPDAMAQKPLLLFSHELGWYRERLRGLALANGRITWARLGRILNQAIVDHSRDRVLASIITADDDPATEVGRHYATPPIRKLQEIYVRVTSSLRDELCAGGHEMEPLRLQRLADPDLVIGSPLCPTVDTFGDMIRALKARISPPGVNCWTIDRHNALTAYVVQIISVAAAYRAVRTPYQSADKIHALSGLAFIVDKGLLRGRLAVNTDRLVLQTRLYDNYLIRLAAFLRRPRSPLACYFLREDLSEEEVTPSSVMGHLKGWLPVANAARHLMYTRLLELGMPEVRDCLCGHGGRGEEPFRLSSFQYTRYKRELAIVIDELLDELEFEVLDITQLW